MTRDTPNSRFDRNAIIRRVQSLVEVDELDEESLVWTRDSSCFLYEHQRVLEVVFLFPNDVRDAEGDRSDWKGSISKQANSSLTRFFLYLETP